MSEIDVIPGGGGGGGAVEEVDGKTGKVKTVKYIHRSLMIPLSQAPGNTTLADMYFKKIGSEIRTITHMRVRTGSGTVKVTVTRGEGGVTEIAALKEIAASSTEDKIVELTQELADKDRVVVATTGEAACKGLYIDIYEKVEG